jgi:hypothetical protein
MQAKTLHGAVPALLEPCGPGGLKGNPALFVGNVKNNAQNSLQALAE